MSEYQFVHFIAIDRPLSDEQMEFMQRQSTRATLSRREFTNEYHFGDFHGDSREMMRRGFDLHLHFANYGIRKLMFRLPAGLPCGKAGFKPFALKYNLEWTPDDKGPGGVLSIEPESDGADWDGYVDGLEDLLTELTPVREMLMAGDLRPLYLAWLACNPYEGKEPPVPAGLKKLPAALTSFCNFYEMDFDLLQAAAEESVKMDERHVPDLPIKSWLEGQSASQRLSLIEQLLLDDTGIVRADTLAEIRKSLNVPAWPVTRTKRTIDDLREFAERQAAIQQEKDAAAQEKERLLRLKRMKENPAATVQTITKLIAERSTQKYSEAVALLCQLRDVLGPDDGPPFTQAVAQQLRNQTPAPRGLISMLKKHEFLK